MDGPFLARRRPAGATGWTRSIRSYGEAMTKEEYRASIARSIDEKIEKEFPSFLDLPFALANLRTKLLLDLAADLHCLLEKARV